MEEFLELRKWFFCILGKILDSDAGKYHKSYEGEFEVSYLFPSIFDAESPINVCIQLDCYVLGPYRHYKWDGENMHETVKKCKDDLEQWIKEALDED